MKLYTPSGETPAGMAHRSIGAAEEVIVAGKEERRSVGRLVINVKNDVRALSLSLKRSYFGCLLSDYRYAGE